MATFKFKTRGQAYYEDDFKKNSHKPVAVMAHRFTIGDVAAIKDTFEERNAVTRFQWQKRLYFLAISVGEDPDVMATTKAVKDYVATGAAFFAG